MEFILEADELFDGSGAAPLRQRCVLVRDGRIAAVSGPVAEAAQERLRVPVLAPGFLDLQINGAGDAQFNDAPSVATLSAMVRGAAQGGTAWILPTYITAPGRSYRAALEAASEAVAQGVPGILGLHLEGPFLSPRRPGIHPADAIRLPDAEDLEVLRAAQGMVRLMTLAPEETGPGPILSLVRAGWTVFAGHSEAQPEDLARPVDAGLSGATHLFNAMSQMAGRAPGLVGAVLSGQLRHAGIIADGFHVHPASIRAAALALGPERLCLVTDAMLTLGGTRTEFRIGDKTVRLEGGRLVDDAGTLGGAHLAMDQAVRNLIAFAGVSRGEALRMASGTPAMALGLGDEIGRIVPGYRAGLTLLNRELHAVGTISDGKFTFR